MKSKVAAALAVLSLAGPMAAHAALIYTFHYDPWENYEAATISFTAPSFMGTTGDTLTYLSGDINGCAPGFLSIESNAFATPSFAIGSCGDGLGSAVDGLYFRPDVMPPLTAGVFVSTEAAGRQFQYHDGGASIYTYTSGSLTIIGSVAVSEPATLALLGIGLLGCAIGRRRSVA